MIILLVLLPALALSEDASLIDFKKCGPNGEALICYCAETTQTLEIYQYETSNGDKITQCENVGIQHKFFNDQNALFQMQVMGPDTNQLGEEPEIMVYHQFEGQPADKDKKKLFGCKKTKDGKIVLIGNKEILKKYRISLFEDQTRSRFRQGIVLCAVYVKYAKTLKNDLSVDKTMMEFNNKEYLFKNSEITLFEVQAIKCDPNSIKELTFSNDYILSPLRNRDKDVLNCDDYNVGRKMYTFRYQNDKKSEGGEIKELVCKTDESGDYSYFIWKGEMDENNEKNMEKILDIEPYKFYCGAKIEEVCETPIEGCASTDPLCPTPKQGAMGEPSALTCSGNKWLIDGGYYNPEVVCKKDGTKNSAKFFVHLPVKGELPVSKDARCFTEYDCKLKSMLNLPKAEGGESEEALVDDSNGQLKCRDRVRTLTIFHPPTNELMNSSTVYVCDPIEGFYKNGSQVVQSNSRVRCKDTKSGPTREQVAADKTENQVILYIIGATGAFLVGVFLVGGCIVLIIKHKTKLNIKNLKNMKTMKREELVATCKEDFAIYLRATPSSANLIVEGLKKIDRLLREEIDNPDVWAEACKFLMRFHATLQKTDWPIRYMFSRYMYLQASKIIGKHGWCTSKKIRNYQRDGLIRTIALHLLSFAWDDKTSPESAKLLVAGFHEIGFKGNSQYPLAGLLWSMVCYVHPHRLVAKADPTKQVIFDEKAFQNTLRAIVDGKHNMYIPPDQTIAPFGSVPQQAAFAMGALPATRFVNTQALNIFYDDLTFRENGAVVPKSMFRGMFASLYRMPITVILESFSLISVKKQEPVTDPVTGEAKPPEPTSLEKLHQVAPAEEWNALVDEAALIATYYGRHIDTKTFYARFMPDKPGPDFVQMQLEQMQFEEAVEKDKEHIRSWFMANTDKDEFKKKPDYSKNAKAGEVKPTDNNACTPVENNKSDAAKSAAKSSAGSSASKSSEKPASPSGPKDAAAPAAP